MKWTNELDNLLALTQVLEADELPRFLGYLENIRAVAWRRLSAGSEPSRAEQVHDELIRVEEAARRLGVGVRHLYNFHSRYPFTRRVGNSLRFSSQGIDNYIRRKCALTPMHQGAMLSPADALVRRPQEDKAQ